MKSIIYLNGPSKVGKDSIGNELGEILGFATMEKFAAPLKKAAGALLDVAPSQFENQEFKSKPVFEGNPTTARDLLIGLSETLMKPTFGKDVFGRLMANQIGLGAELGWFDYYIITDCGFVEEVEAVVNAFPDAEHLIFRLHRQDCDFTGDSRGYISLGKELTNLKEYDIDNNTTIGAAAAAIAQLVK